MNGKVNHSDYKPEQWDEFDIADIIFCFDWTVDYLVKQCNLDLSDDIILFGNLFVNFDMRYQLGPIAESKIFDQGLWGEWIIKSGWISTYFRRQTNGVWTE